MVVPDALSFSEMVKTVQFRSDKGLKEGGEKVKWTSKIYFAAAWSYMLFNLDFTVWDSLDQRCILHL